MKNFKKFEKAYVALLTSRANILKLSSRYVSPYYEDAFLEARRISLANISSAIDVLEDWFSADFPRHRLDACSIEQFSYREFFEFLKKYPELAKKNKDSLKSLLFDMRGGNLITMRIDRIPDISEIIPD